MFTSAHRTAARERNSAHSALTTLLETRDTWFDGTVRSVDRRLAQVNRALPDVVRTAATDNDMMLQAEHLREEIAGLHELRRELSSANLAPVRRLPKVSSIGPLSTAGREFISREIKVFLADNEDAIGDPEELDVRAEDHADREIENYQLNPVEARAIVSHFRLAVDWSARNLRRANNNGATVKAAAVNREAGLANIPDDALFD